MNERNRIISDQLKQAIYLFLCLTLLPISGVQAAEDPVRVLLQQAPQPGVNFDPVTQSWYFYGVPIEQVRYKMPGTSVDLIRVMFMGSAGTPYKVWVAVGMDMHMSAEYLALGPWKTVEQVQTIHLRGMLLRISISETIGMLMPQVDEHGIKWKKCDGRELCDYGQLFDTMHHDLSNLFIKYEMAPGWYPWGFLFWDIEIAYQFKEYNPNDSLWRRIHDD